MGINSMSSSVERQVLSNQSGVEINNDIFDPHDIKIMIDALKENTNKTRESNNIRKWKYYKELKYSYGLENDDLKRELYDDDAINSLERSGELDSNQALFNELIEFSFRELLDYFFQEAGIKVLKTSKYDDIKSGIDFILEFETDKGKDYIGIDLTLSTDEVILYEKGTRNQSTPKEFSLVKNEKKLTTKLKENEKIDMDRFVLPIEPNFAQQFLYEFIDMVRTEEIPKNIDEQTAYIAFEEAKESAAKKGIDVNTIVESIQSQLISNLSTNH